MACWAQHQTSGSLRLLWLALSASVIAESPATAQVTQLDACEEAAQALSVGDRETALKGYSGCLAQEGLGQEERIEALYLRGELLISLGRYEEARDDLAEAVLLAPDFLPAVVSLAIALGESGDYAAGVDVLDTYDERFPVSETGFFLSIRGWLKNNAGQFEEAIADLNEAIRLGPVDANLYLNRAHSLAQLGRIDDAGADYEAAAALDPENSRAYGEHGHMLRTQGRYAEAIQKLDRAVERDPRDTAAWIERGRTNSEMGNLRGAIADFTRAAETDPGEAWAYADRAQALMLLGDDEQAMLDLERALRLSPDNVNALVLHGELLNDQGRYQEARRDLEAALAIDPDNSYTRHEFAGALFGLGLWDQSLAEYNEAIRLEPSNSYHIGARGFVRLRLGESAAALEDFNKAIADHPQAYYWYMYRAHALAWIGKEYEAARDIDLAIALMSEEKQTWLSNEICWDLLLQAQTGLAEPMCQQAVDLSNDFQAHDSHAFFDWQMGRQEAAKAHLTKALALSGGDHFFEPARRMGDFPTVLAQGLLMYLGYRPDEPDVANTEKTRQAIEAFQRDHGLPVTGEVTEALLTALKAAKP
ncbi:MAG TPA: tetratricopeptide repeat protein [Kiloniellaceae bacterium]|nr:tetratricopeptide repeat protein [Kiloniellaceae bacterium]